MTTDSGTAESKGKHTQLYKPAAYHTMLRAYLFGKLAIMVSNCAFKVLITCRKLVIKCIDKSLRHKITYKHCNLF